jgi:chromosome segregation ATPase
MRNPVKVALALVVAALLILGAALFTFYRTPRTQQPDRMAQLEADNRDLRARTEQLQRESEELRQRLGQAAEPATAARQPQSAAPDETVKLESVRLMTQLQSKLAAANASIAELKNRSEELQANVARLTEENKRLAAESADVKDSLASTQRIVTAMETENNAKSDRIVQLEAAARKSRDENAAAMQRASQVPAVLRELEDINRRRENYLTSLQRRYRELNDIYRGVALRLDRSRDNPGASDVGSEVSRMQTAVQLAEDELRQLIALNTQAQRVAQKLTALK